MDDYTKLLVFTGVSCVGIICFFFFKDRISL